MDYQASTPVDPRVVEVMLPYLFEKPGNPHATDHVFGWEAAKAVDEARQTLAEAIGADEDELVFTSGATEANNLAILGVSARRDAGKNRILVSEIEHKSVLAAAEAACERFKLKLDYIPVNSNGIININTFQKMISDDILLVSVMNVNNEIGSIQPIREISILSHQVGALVHTDAVQALGLGDFQICDAGVDLASFSAHKIYGPKGIGALYIARHLQNRIEPQIWGGGQQNGLRAGTVPVPLCVGFAAAARLVSDADAEAERIRIRTLRDRLVEGTRQIQPDARLMGPTGPLRHFANANLFFPGHDASDLLARLQPRLAASTGSACTSGIHEPSHVLTALGLSQEDARCCVRFSLGRFSTENDVDTALEVLKTVL